MEHDTKTTNNTAVVGGLDCDSVRLEEETHEIVEVNIDQGLPKLVLAHSTSWRLDQGLLGDAASLHDGPEGRYERMESKDAIKADLDSNLEGSEGGDGDGASFHNRPRGKY